MWASAAAESLTLMNSYPPMNAGRTPNHPFAALCIESRAPRAAARPRSADPPAVLVETMQVRFARRDENTLARRQRRLAFQPQGQGTDSITFRVDECVGAEVLGEAHL